MVSEILSCLTGYTSMYLLCEPPGEEGDEVLDINLHEALEVRFDKVYLVLLLRQLRQVVRVQRLALVTYTILHF